MKMRLFFYQSIVLLFLFIIPAVSTGQINIGLISGSEPDTNYINDYTDHLTTRIYTSRKYTNFSLNDQNLKKDIKYHPNDRLNLGIGASYRGFALNIGINFPFVNNDDDKYGETSYLDLQSHILFRKLTVEFWFSYFKGYYITNPDQILKQWNSPEVYPKRGDMQSLVGGINSYYILNYKKFSYRAAFAQDEWQKKSAGSLLLGGSIYGIHVSADSSFIPVNIFDSTFFNGINFNQTTFTTISANIGYAHTFVIIKKMFFTFSLNGGLGVGGMNIVSTEPGMESDESKIKINSNYTFRFATGYNSRRAYAGISYVYSSIQTPTPIEKTNLNFGFGNVRFNFAWRFKVKKKNFDEKEIDKVL